MAVAWVLRQRLGPDAQHALLYARRGRQFELKAGRFGRGALDGDWNEVHGRAADEARDVHVHRVVVDLARWRDLLQDAVLHHRDAVAHRHRLDLVVGDIYEGRVQRAVLLLELDASLDAQLGIQVRQRLVEKKGLRFAHDRATERHPLALAARQLAWLALQQRAELEDVGRRVHAARDVL